MRLVFCLSALLFLSYAAYAESFSASYDAQSVKEKYVKSSAAAYLDDLRGQVALTDDQVESLTPAVEEYFFDMNKIKDAPLTDTARNIQNAMITNKLRKKLQFTMSPDQWEMFQQQAVSSASAK